LCNLHGLTSPTCFPAQQRDAWLRRSDEGSTTVVPMPATSMSPVNLPCSNRRALYVGVCQVVLITMSSNATYTPSDRDTSLAKVGETVLFEVTATNDGNVDVDNTAMSNDLFWDSSAGG